MLIIIIEYLISKSMDNANVVGNNYELCWLVIYPLNLIGIFVY